VYCDVGALLAGALKATLLHIYQNCVSKLHAYVGFILGVYCDVGALLAGALKATLLRIYHHCVSKLHA
uniref:hypothetical protein n=1 Tax=uncultured Pseudoalteromonas sp. TaxID=114053 RepID=UPI0030C88F7C